MRDSQVIVENSLALIAKNVAVWGLNLVLVIFLPRYLGDTGLGQITFAVHLTTMFAALIIFGMTKLVIKDIARDRSKVNSYLSNVLVTRIVLSILVFAVIALITNSLSYSSDAKTVIYIAGLTMIATCFNSAMVSVLQGVERMKWQALAEAAGKLTAVGVGMFLLVQGYGVVAYALALLGGMALNFLFNTIYILKKFRIRPQFSLSTSKLLLIGGIPFLLMGLFQNLYSQADVVMLRLFINEGVVGWYGAALQLYSALSVVPLVVTTAVLPSLARTYVSDIERMKQITKKSIAVIVMATLPVAVGTSLLSGRIIDLLNYPAVFDNSIPLLTILALALPITSTLMIIATVVIAADKQNKWALATLVTLVLNVVLNLIAIPLCQRVYGNGAIGAAATSILSESFLIVIGIRLMPKGIFDMSILKAVLKSIVAVVAMAGIVWIAMVGGLHTALLVVIGAVVYLGLSVILKTIVPADINVIKEVLLRRGRDTDVSQAGKFNDIDITEHRR